MSHLRIRWWECLCLAALAVLGAVTASAGPGAAEEKTVPVRRIFVTGGGFLSGDPDHRPLRFVVSLTGKANPVVCNLPTASGDNLERLATTVKELASARCNSCIGHEFQA